VRDMTFPRAPHMNVRALIEGDAPPILSSAVIWSPVPNETEIGRENALFRRTDHWLPA